MLKETYFQVKNSDEVIFAIVDDNEDIVSFHLMMFKSELQQTMVVSLVSDGFMKTHVIGYDGTDQTVVFDDIGGIEGRCAEVVFEGDMTIVHIY